MAKLSFTPKRKLSSAVIMGEDVRVLWKRERKANPNVDKIVLYRIAGTVKLYDKVDSPFGESLRLIGDFIAVNAKTGEVFRSNRAFLPGIMTDGIVAHISGNANVEFSFEVSIIPDENVKSATGYCYSFEPLLDVKENDQMKNMAKSIGVELEPRQKALPK